MLKFVVAVYRRPDWDAARFRDYFVQVHGKLAAAIPGLIRYTQNLPAPDPERRPPQWDAISELTFAGYDAMQAAWRTPEGEAATRDLAACADLARTSWSIVEERRIL